MPNTAKISVIDYGEFEEVISQAELFTNAGTETISEFLSSSSIVEYKKNENVFNHEDKADWFYFVKSGWIKLYRETMDGDEAVLDIFAKGDIFGENAIFENFIYSASATCIDNAELIKLPIGILAERINTHPKLALNFLKHSNLNSAKKNRDIEHRNLQSATQRIGCFLLRFSELSIKQQKIDLPFDKTLLALKLGMKPETFSRALKKLNDEANVLVDGKSFHIQSELLSKYCCSACSSQFPCED